MRRVRREGEGFPPWREMVPLMERRVSPMGRGLYRLGERSFSSREMGALQKGEGLPQAERRGLSEREKGSPSKEKRSLRRGEELLKAGRRRLSEGEKGSLCSSPSANPSVRAEARKKSKAV